MALQKINTQGLVTAVRDRLTQWLNEGAIMVLLTGPGPKRSGLEDREYLIWLLLSPRSLIREFLESFKPTYRCSPPGSLPLSSRYSFASRRCSS